MTLSKRKGTYYYAFRVGGLSFRGSTGTAQSHEAIALVAKLKAEAERQLKHTSRPADWYSR